MTTVTQLMSYEKYNLITTKRDVATIKSKCKIYPWEWIPVVGAIIYLTRMSVEFAGINRGELRKNITKYHVIIIFSSFLVLHYLSLIFAFIFKWIISLGIKKTEKWITEEEKKFSKTK